METSASRHGEARNRSVILCYGFPYQRIYGRPVKTPPAVQRLAAGLSPCCSNWNHFMLLLLLQQLHDRGRVVASLRPLDQRVTHINDLCRRTEQTHCYSVHASLWGKRPGWTQLDRSPPSYEPKQLRAAFMCKTHPVRRVCRLGHYVARAGISQLSTVPIDLHRGSEHIYDHFV